MSPTEWTLGGFEWPTAANDADTKALSDVRDDNAHIVIVPEDGATSGFAFTVGLYLQFGHPELLIVGLPPEPSADVLNEIIELVEEGGTFADGDESDDVLRKLTVRFTQVPRDAYSEWLGYARWFYASVGEDAFPCLQVLWPTNKGRFPGQKGVPDWIKKRQPVLGVARP